MSTTNTTAPVMHLATSSLIWLGHRRNNPKHEAAITEIRRRFANGAKASDKLGAFLAKYDEGTAVAAEEPVKVKAIATVSKKAAKVG